MKKKLKIISIFLIVITILIVTSNVVLALNIENYKPGPITGADKLKDIGNIIVGIIQVIGSILSVIVLIIMGIQYVLGSAEERAEYKEKMMPYIIGAVMIFAISNILGIISDFMSGAFNFQK